MTDHQPPTVAVPQTDAVKEGMRALMCLRLEVPASIADDVQRRVVAAFESLAPPAALDEAVGLLRGLLSMADALTAEHVAEGVHTGLRKGTDAADSHTLWQAISGSETSAWGDACAFFAESMTDECVGFGKQIEAARAFLANLEPSRDQKREG